MRTLAVEMPIIVNRMISVLPIDHDMRGYRIRKSSQWVAVRVLNQTLAELKLEKHPDKTFIGKIEIGFDFLGYHFSPDGLSIAEKTIENFYARATQLYEQKPGEVNSSRLELYVKRWKRWTCAGLDRCFPKETNT